MQSQDFSGMKVESALAPVRAMGAESSKSLPVLVREMYDLILVDEPLPVAQLSRYLATICLVGIERSCSQPDRRQWVATMNNVLKTTHAIQEQKDTDRSGRKTAIMRNIFEAASRRMEAEGLLDDDGADEGEKSPA